MTARRRWAVTFLAGVWVLGLGLAMARATGDSSPTPASGADAGGVDREVAGIAEPPEAQEPSTAEGGHQRTWEGAVEAATAYLLALDGAALFDDVERERLVDLVAADVSRDEMGVALAEVTSMLRAKLNLDDGRQDDGFVWRGVPAGWRVDSFDRDHAVVSVWSTGVVIARGVPLVQPGWRTTEVELVWERGDWRLVEFRSGPGPEPPPVGGHASSATAARLINEFEPYHHMASGSSLLGRP